MQGILFLLPLFQNMEKMKIENTKAQMRKGMLEYCVLLLLSKEDLYSGTIISYLKEAQMIVVEGTLYPLLSRLKNAALLDYEWQESTQGPPRKYYKLTPKGRVALEALNEMWEGLNESIEMLRTREQKKIGASK